jgi:hypothetical protein
MAGRIKPSVTVLLVTVALACTPSEPPGTTAPVGSASASASSEAYATNAKKEYEAAEALASSGKLAEAADAFTKVAQRFAYSRFAKEAQLRIAQMDEKLGKPEAVEEYRAWAKDHPSDERAAAILARSKTVGDVTCHADADCAVTTKHDCCECCPSGPYATSKAWLSWEAGQCATVKCAACLNPQCAPVEAARAARCKSGSCELAP